MAAASGSALLPDPDAAPQRAAATRLPPDGCYLVDFRPTNPPVGFFIAYVGTLRVESTSGRVIASGDLYDREIDLTSDDNFTPLPDLAAGIPIFPLASYRYYLRVTAIRETDAGFQLAFEALRYGNPQISLINGANTYWTREAAFTASMVAVPGDDGAEPRPSFSGEVFNESGVKTADLKIDRVSPHLRKATVEIDRVPASPAPRGNGAGADWKSVFREVGWDIDVHFGDEDVAEPAGGVWTGAEAHKAMQLRREKTDLNTEWHYHLLCVQLIEGLGVPKLPGERGYMYDVGGGGPGNMPREGLMVASEWPIPDKEEWGQLRGQRAADTVTYFRTAVHELGHAMGLWHNKVDNGFMNSTDVVAANSLIPPRVPFPANMLWSFAPDDRHRLRHWPDIVVRPGGTPVAMDDRAPQSAFMTDRLRLDVAAISETVPLGAPVRIDLSLTNMSDKPVDAPASLSLKSGLVRGRVTDSQGTARTFAPLVINESGGAGALAPGGVITDSLTLFQGAEGALFPVVGPCRIVVEIAWHGKSPDPEDSMDFIVTGETTITVTPAQNSEHAQAADAVLNSPDMLFVIAFGGDHLDGAIAAIEKALACEVLRPHFAYIEARRRAMRFGDRAPDLRGAAALIDGTTVMNAQEYLKSKAWVQR